MRSLDDVDYLLGVDDWSRMGALRLSVDGGRTYLGKGTDVPKLVRLPELLSASRSVSAGTEGWEELFGRIVLSIAVHNTDDHLRNHGLLRTAAGWRLSPLFDVNPNPYLEEERALPVYGETGDGEVEGLSELGSSLGIDRRRQARIVARVTGAFAHWKSVARRLKCGEREISMFSPVIEDRLEALATLT